MEMHNCRNYTFKIEIHVLRFISLSKKCRRRAGSKLLAISSLFLDARFFENRMFVLYARQRRVLLCHALRPSVRLSVIHLFILRVRSISS